MHPYACSLCGGEAKVTPAGVVSRACGHDDATVIAERTSILYGKGGCAPKTMMQRAVAALCKLAGM